MTATSNDWRLISNYPLTPTMNSAQSDTRKSPTFISLVLVPLNQPFHAVYVCGVSWSYESLNLLSCSFLVPLYRCIESHPLASSVDTSCNQKPSIYLNCLDCCLHLPLFTILKPSQVLFVECRPCGDSNLHSIVFR